MRPSVVWMGISSLFVCLLTGCSRPEKVVSQVDDVNHARLGVLLGSMGESIAKVRFPDAHVKRFDEVPDAVAAIVSGQLDAVIASLPAANLATRRQANLRVLPEVLDDEETCFALRLEDTELLTRVNEIIQQLAADGTITKLNQQWLSAEGGETEALSIPASESGPPLKVGICSMREPFTFLDPAGNITGHDATLSRLVAMRLNRPIEFVDLKFAGLIPALQAGKIDLVATGMSSSDERRKQVAFSKPYYMNHQVVIARKTADASADKGQAKIAKVSDLRKRRVGVLMGSAHEAWVLKNLPEATMLQYKAVADVSLALKTEKVDAALYDAETIKELMREDPTIGRLDEDLFVFNVGVGFADKSDALRDEFNSFLKMIQENGVYDDIVRRWIDEQKTEMPDLPNNGRNGELVAGVCDVGMPFIATQNNRLVGFDIELIERFAAHQGKVLRLNNMDFGSLIAAVASGKADLIISSIYITPEREQQIDFSDPYFKMATQVGALKSTLGLEPSQTAEQPGFLRKLVDSFYANLVRENRYLLIVDGLKTTVLIALMSAVLGTLLGAILCYMRMSSLAILQLPAKLYISILRGTPVLVVLMLVFYVVFASIDIPPTLAAVLAFGMNFGAYAAEIFRTGVEGVDGGQVEAGLAMGFTRVATFRFIVLPQMVRNILPVFKGEFISLVKMTSIVGYIAVQDLTKAGDIIRSRTFDAFFPLIVVAILYFLISGVFIFALDCLERGMDPTSQRRSRRGI